MKLTEKKAIELSIELWTWLAETGENKNEWPEWKRHGGQYEECENDCFLCKGNALTPNTMSCFVMMTGLRFPNGLILAPSGIERNTPNNSLSN